MTYSMDLRERVVQAVEEGESIASVARRYRVARSTVRDWRDRTQRDALAPETPGPRGPVKLTAADERRLRDAVNRQPGITAKQLIPRLSVEVVESTVCRALNRLRLTVKKSR